jgi:hypothetical protein
MDSGKVGPVQQQIEAKVLVNVEITLHQYYRLTLYRQASKSFSA